MPLILPRHLTIQLNLIDYLGRNIRLLAPGAGVKLTMPTLGPKSAYAFMMVLAHEGVELSIAYTYEGAYRDKGNDIIRFDTLTFTDVKKLETISIIELPREGGLMASTLLAHQAVKRLLQKEATT